MLAASLRFFIFCIFSCVVLPTASHSESLYSALAHAYASNPDIEAARAGLRATDETVAIAKAGRRPNVAAEAKATYTDENNVVSKTSQVSLTVNQALFDGFRAKNSILAANSRVLAGRESLRSTEMDVLIGGVQAYVDVLLYQQITSIRKQNLDFLTEQLKVSRARLDAGEGTRTDVAQAQAQLAAAKAQLTAATTNLRSSRAIYKQIIGHKPVRLKVPKLPTNFIPKSLNLALGLSMQNHPALAAALHTIDASEYDIGVAKSALLPGVNLSGSVTEPNSGRTTAQIGARLTIPFYSGGASAARVRQSKERLGEARLRLDSVRRQVRQIVIDSWVNFQSSKARIEAGNEEVNATRLALSGVVEERNVGQRTLLDVLNSQSNVLNARESLAQSQRNTIVAAYNVLYTTGQLTANGLNLNTKRYNPETHFKQVEDKWFGLRAVTK